MARYYVMECEGIHPLARIESYPDLPGGPWYSGRRITVPIPRPLEYRLDPDYPGDPKAMHGETGIPLMRTDVAATLARAGVDNIELFEAVIIDPVTQERFRNYCAFNVVGLVSCADMSKSTLIDPVSSATTIDVDFDELHIDEDRAHDLLLFRLAESVNAIVVHEKIRAVIEASQIGGFFFYGPGEWAG